MPGLLLCSRATCNAHTQWQLKLYPWIMSVELVAPNTWHVLFPILSLLLVFSTSLYTIGWLCRPSSAAWQSNKQGNCQSGSIMIMTIYSLSKFNLWFAVSVPELYVTVTTTLCRSTQHNRKSVCGLLRSTRDLRKPLTYSDRGLGPWWARYRLSLVPWSDQQGFSFVSVNNTFQRSLLVDNFSSWSFDRSWTKPHHSGHKY